MISSRELIRWSDWENRSSDQFEGTDPMISLRELFQCSVWENWSNDQFEGTDPMISLRELIQWSVWENWSNDQFERTDPMISLRELIHQFEGTDLLICLRKLMHETLFNFEQLAHVLCWLRHRVRKIVRVWFKNITQRPSLTCIMATSLPPSPMAAVMGLSGEDFIILTISDFWRGDMRQQTTAWHLEATCNIEHCHKAFLAEYWRTKIPYSVQCTGHWPPNRHG